MRIRKGIVVWICAAALMMLPGLAHQTKADQIYDGGTLPVVTVSCPPPEVKVGGCHVMTYEWRNSYSLTGEYSCLYTGKLIHYCNHFAVKLNNFIVNIMGG